MTKIKQNPSLRFPSYQDNWVKFRLGDITDFSKGKGISKSDIVSYGSLECIRYGELYTHYSEVIDKVFSKTNLASENLVLSKENDVIIPSSGETKIDIAKASCIIKSGVAIGGDLNILRLNHNGIFVSYYLNSKKKLEIASLAQGISVVHLYSSQLANLTVLFPSLPEQQKIAAFLSAVDEKIQQLTKKKQLLEKYKKGLMQKIFNREIRFKDESGRGFPEWEPNILANIGTVIMGQSPDSKSYNVEGDGYYLIQGNADIKDRRSAPKIWTNEPTKLCEVGDLLLSVRAPVGSVAVSNHVACIGRGVCAIRSNEKKLLSTFLFQYLVFCESKWIKIEQGSTFTSINSNDIKTFFIPRPSMLEQNKISSFLSQFDKKKEFLELQIREAISWKKGLLQQMFV